LVLVVMTTSDAFCGSCALELVVTVRLLPLPVPPYCATGATLCLLPWPPLPKFASVAALLTHPPPLLSLGFRGPVSELEDILAEIDRRRLSDEPLRRQLSWRVQALDGNADFSDERVCAAFAEVFAAYEPPGFNLLPLPERCEIDAEEGGILV